MYRKLLVSNIQRFSLHDGPGIRSTVFLKGCPMKCLWCQNPESISARSQLAFYKERCLLMENKYCPKYCIPACPKNAISYDDVTKQINLDFKLCDSCGDCVSACPSETFEGIGQQMTVQEVMSKLKADEHFYKDGGGITISGGEPFLQTEGVSELLSQCKEGDIHTLMETSAALHWEQSFGKVLPNVDKFYIDIKTSQETHRELTGISQDLILNNVQRLIKEGGEEKLELRLPVIPSLNDTPEILKSIAKTLHTLEKPQITLLRYNKFWESKIDRIQTTQKPLNLTPIRPIEEVRDILIGEGIDARVAESSTLINNQSTPLTYEINTQDRIFSDRIWELHEAVKNSQPTVCMERTNIVTNYYKNKKNRNKKPQIQRAEVINNILTQKSANIYPRELLVGNYNSAQGAIHIVIEFGMGLVMLTEAYRLNTRKYCPVSISTKDKLKLLSLIPFWLNHNFFTKCFHSVYQTVKMLLYMLKMEELALPELAGYGHIVPNYQDIIQKGTEIIIKESREKALETDDPNRKNFYKSIEIICRGLENYSENYAKRAEELLVNESDPVRIKDLKNIISVCRNIPSHPAKTFHEAIQMILFLQIALNLDNIDQGISPGRLDNILYPYYKKDIEEGRITREEAKDLCAAFCIKLCELMPGLPESGKYSIGGLSSGQMVCIGGVNKEGEDMTNELSYIFLDIMREIKPRQPNFSARIHKNSPREFIRRISENLRDGCASPAVINDDIYIPILTKGGRHTLEDARDYILLGCVEPSSCGNTMGSTDAALINVVCPLEYALGLKKPGSNKVSKATQLERAKNYKDIEEVWEMYCEELSYLIEKMYKFQQKIEIGHQKYMPVPLFSLLIEGCFEKGIDAAWGGAKYNSTGLQAIGCADIADSFTAMEHVVFKEKKCSMSELLEALNNNFKGREDIQAYLENSPKFGNNEPRADKWMGRAMNVFADLIKSRYNLRGGPMLPGYYAMTLHVGYGINTGALPSGRELGKPLSSGITPTNCTSRGGPTSTLNSIASLPLQLTDNGSIFNFTLDNANLGGDQGVDIVGGLIKGYFEAGGNQSQVNVFDPALLIKAKENPGLYPWLLVRVSGYTAYFKDLTPDMQQEIIDRYVTKSV